MKKGTVGLSLLGVLLFSYTAVADICSVKPEAESKKDTLPVKYKRLKAENEKLSEELSRCGMKKSELEVQIIDLKAKISRLEQKRAELQTELLSYPSKEDLESQIRELERKLGR